MSHFTSPVFRADTSTLQNPIKVLLGPSFHRCRTLHKELLGHRKTLLTRPAGFLQPIQRPSRPLRQISMGLLRPFSKLTSGNKWVTVATDYLTRYAEAKLLLNVTAAKVAKFFMESILLQHRAPEVLIADRGTAFTAEPTLGILHYSRTNHCRTATYHRQTNSLIECLNKTIADMFAIYIDPPHKT